jgi:hypothetical protein
VEGNGAAAPPPGPARSLRDRPVGKLLALAVVLLFALGVARGCASRGGEISQREAVEIARQEVDFRPERTQVRLIRQGFQSRPLWAVSFSTLDEDGALDRVTVVVVDARTREVTEVRESSR